MQASQARSLLALLAAATTAWGPVWAQTTWFVDATAPAPGAGTLASPYADLQYALTQATTVSGDTLLVAPGTYFGGFDFLGKDVVVQSTGGAAVTILDGQGAWPPPTPPVGDTSPIRSVVSFKTGESPGAVLDGFTVQHGRGTGTVSSTDGGGIYVEGASPTLQNLVVRENRASYGSGMRFANSAAIVRDCTITGNTNMRPLTGTTWGVGLHTTSAIVVERCTFSNNAGYPVQQGGGAWASAGAFVDCTFENNTATFGGGAYAANATVTFDGCSLSNNSASNGEGAGLLGAGVWGGTLTRCEIAGNHTAHQGAGAWGSTLVDCWVHHNVASAQSNFGTGPFGGGGAFNSTLVRCVVEHNEARGIPGIAALGAKGGGVYGGSATDCDIHDNAADSSGNPFLSDGGGGAAFTTLLRCDVDDNVARTLAGGAPLAPGGGLLGGSATACRIWGNGATHGAGAANASLVNCTVSANDATTTGGGLASVYNALSTASATDSVLWGNVPNSAVAVVGTTTITWSDVEGGFPGTGNVNADPLFQSAANNDFHLLAGSPCIDAGNPARFDPNGSRVDMGAFPFECGVHNYCVGKVNSLGCVPTAGSTGTPAFSGADDFHVTATSVRKNSLGMLLWSHGADNVSFFNGTLCVGQPLVRAGLQSSGGTGTGPNCTGQFDFHFTHAYMISRGIAPLQTIFCQWYMRDATHPDGTGVGLSDGVSFTVCP